jgi:DNA (cytosine-5)-methyltransferase 1
MIEAEFARLGYRCDSKVLNARDFGVAQDRERLFIVGSRDGEKFEWPRPTHGTADSGWSLFGSGPLSPHVSLRQVILADGHWRYGELGESAVLWVKNVVRPHDEPVTWSLDRVSPTVGAHQAAKLAIAPFGVPPEQLSRQQWHTLGRRQGDTPPVFVEHEYLTDLELLTLQSFPRHWYLHGTRMERAFQIGNAVPPRLAQAVGDALVSAMAGTVSEARKGALA